MSASPGLSATARTLALLAAAALLAGPTRAREEPEEGGAFLDRVAAAWGARDLAGWMALWDIPDAARRAAEEELARAAFAGDETRLTFLRRPAAGKSPLVADVQVFVAQEPRARVAFWRLVAERRGDRWALSSRQDNGQLDGLVHLALEPRAWHARGATLRLADFELRLEDGTLFTTGEPLGPTALVFVGRGRVVFSPGPAAEREQLRQFAGVRALDTSIGWAYVRLHPDAVAQLVDAARLEPERQPLARRAQAERLFQLRSGRSFALDTALPRSPWWLLPAGGDAVVDFPWGRRVLTFAVASGEMEDVNLFDRDRKQQICVYPSGGRLPLYDEDSGRAVDVLEQDLLVRFEPERARIEAVHTMRLQPLDDASTVRLRLDDDFRVSSITTGEGTSLLFFRVREQNSLVVSLGTLGERGRQLTLVTRYSGRHDPAPVDQEVVQILTRGALGDSEEGWVDEPPLVYSNRTAWYPRPSSDDFSPASAAFDTPEGWLGVTGGELVSLRTEGRRTRAEYRLVQPGKFLTAVVGRFEDVGLRQEGEQAVRGFATLRSAHETQNELQQLEEVLRFYAGLFGPCPYPRLSLAVAAARVPAGHSPPGLLYLQFRPAAVRGAALADDPANFSDLPGYFLAHEAAHQWWGQGTAPANYRERWLSEAWAQYAAALWVRQRSGETAFRGMMDRMAGWATRFDSAGPIHLGQRLGLLRSDPRIFRAVVYDKGAWVLHMLRGRLGDEAFFRGARAFLDTHRFAKAGSQDLREALESASGLDLRPYFERWVYDTGLPIVLWSARTEAGPHGFRTLVDVRAQALPGPVPLEIAVGHEARRVTLDPAGGSWTFESSERPGRLALNDDRGLLARVERVDPPRRPAQR